MSNFTVSPQIEVDMQSLKGRKFDAGKLKWSLIPWTALESVVKVLMFGAIKYGEWNWEGVESVRYKDAAMRHLVSYMKGEKDDEESGLPHLAHLACCVLFLLWKEDRPDEKAIVPSSNGAVSAAFHTDGGNLTDRNDFPARRIVTD